MVYLIVNLMRFVIILIKLLCMQAYVLVVAAQPVNWRHIENYFD